MAFNLRTALTSAAAGGVFGAQVSQVVNSGLTTPPANAGQSPRIQAAPTPVQANMAQNVPFYQNRKIQIAAGAAVALLALVFFLRRK